MPYGNRVEWAKLTPHEKREWLDREDEEEAKAQKARELIKALLFLAIGSPWLAFLFDEFVMKR